MVSFYVWGSALYGDPDKIGMQYSFLRAEPEKPTCDQKSKYRCTSSRADENQMLLMSLQVCLVQHLNQMYALLY